jgi:hypothetical protein
MAEMGDKHEKQGAIPGVRHTLDGLHIFSGILSTLISMPKMAHPGENHGDAQLVGGGDYVLILH